MKKKQSFARNFLIRIPIYDFDLMVSIHEDGPTVKRKALRYLPPGENPPDQLFELSLEPKASRQGRAIMFDCGACLLWLKWNPAETQNFGYLHHELLHIVEFIMERIHQPQGEAWNYLLQYLTNQIYKRL